MKTRALKRFRERLARDEAVNGLWVTLESATVTEIAVAIGMDWVVIDAEHGHLDWKDINEHVRAGLRSDTVVLVRLAERSTSLAKRALDIGADGVVIPWMESVGQLEDAVRDCRYPPEGRRGIGGERATAWGHCLAEHTAEANEHVLVVPLIESVAAIPHVPAMCKVDGVDVFFFGPADFSATAGHRGQWEGPGVADQILALKDTITAAGKHCGLMTTSVKDLMQRREQGFRMFGIGSDTGLLSRALHQALLTVGGDRLPATSLDPADGRVVQSKLACPPRVLCPDRPAVVTDLDDASSVELQPGVIFRPLAGGFCGARGLTTGTATLEPEAFLPCHSHPCTESVTVLEGEAEFTVEGRVYRLGPLDTMVIPRWLPHATRNPDATQPARLHNTFGMTPPARDLVSTEFARRDMPSSSTGLPGFERVIRFASAPRSFRAGSASEFVDLFNESLHPGIEMSSGIIRVQPGGELPAHVLACDQSVCVIDGNATCTVEGQRYSLAGLSTAMVPRGRVHAIVNESSKAVDIIWGCASPIPNRIPVDETCATEPGAAWSSADE
ncbi:MAG: cupin domain-containing protein [Planctomycetes bacterium]|nr:cupin domain-containing protein [Planctomycetota bacterium]